MHINKPLLVVIAITFILVCMSSCQITIRVNDKPQTIVDSTAHAATGHVEVNVVEGPAPIKDIISGKSSSNFAIVPDCSDATATQDCIPTEVVPELDTSEGQANYQRWRAIEEADPQVTDDSTMPPFPRSNFMMKGFK